jgi:hypothetical protein
MKRRVKVTDEYRMARIRRTLLSGQQHAALYLQQLAQGIASEKDIPVAEMTMRMKACIELARGAMAMERARASAQVGPKLFGVVMMQDRISDEGRWERMHAGVVQEAEAIETKAAEPVAALPPAVEGKHGSS